MNETIKELFERKSVRMYTDEKITEEEKRIILESALPGTYCREYGSLFNY